MCVPLRITVGSVCALAFAVSAAAQPNTAPSKIVVSPEHVLSINGRMVFPIGFTIPPPPDAKTPWGKPALEEFRDAGATFIRTGPMRDVGKGERKYTSWDAAWAEREKQFMRAAARRNVLHAVPQGAGDDRQKTS